VLAYRLTANPQVKVLLLEAGGPDKRREIHIPAAYGQAFKSEIDWNYETEPQPHLNNRKLYWPRGKVLGGSSSINAMIYIRGARQDYDAWRDAGNPGWGFDDVLPYFKKSENQERGASAYHGVGGPLNVADLIAPNPMTRAFVAACQQVGLKRNDDFNGPQQEGAGIYQVTQKTGQRHSTAAAFLKPALARPNLTVLTHTHATRILFEKNRAVGVAYIQAGQTREARAAREVILSGGSINSPQLLLLSGVGPADHLRALGIPIVLDLPGVGQNLHDHIAVGAFYYATQPVSLASATAPLQLLQYLLFKKGMLTSNVGEGGAFVKSKPDLPAPDIQYHFGPIHYLNHGLTKMDGHGFATGPTLLSPDSRGALTLRSNDPLAAPAIQPCYLTSSRDMERLLYGLKLAREIVAAKAFDAYRGAEIHPGPSVTRDAALREYIRNGAETLYHPVGTCKMGSDPLAVVNARLQVHGLEGLRVVDAAIMPTVPSGNTNAPTIMIAEKGADLIQAMG
jgi:choline dehydrogenase